MMHSLKSFFLRHFSRITTPGRMFLPQIDGLRFVAIVGIIAFHVREITSFHLGVALNSAAGQDGLINRLFNAGANAVPLFFGISGFILGLPFAKQFMALGPPVNVRGYFIRRVTRLEPPYLIHLIFLFLLCAFTLRNLPAHQHLYHNPHWLSYLMPHILSSLIYSNGFIFGTHPYPNIVLWTLEIEVQFYILAPLLARVFKIRGRIFRRAILAGAILLSSTLLYFNAQEYRIICSLAGTLQFFLVGFLVCDFYLTDWTGPHLGRYRWDLLFVLAFAGTVLFCRERIIGMLLPWLILICLVAAFKGTYCRKILSFPAITLLGGMCYTIYMYHWFMISLLIRPLKALQTHRFQLDLCIQMLLMSVVIFAVCAVLFILFERPFMRKDWPRRLWAFISQRSRSSDGNAGNSRTTKSMLDVK